MPVPEPHQVAAVIVTHNRRALLEQCLQRVAAQTRLPDTILVIDNASDDGTRSMLATHEGVDVLDLGENLGGAGGFHAGLRAAVERGHTWCWLMDDDTLPERDALEALLSAARTAPRADGAAAPLVLASRVEWTDGTLHPMNRPWPKTDVPASQMVDAARLGLMPLRAASFVSVLIHRNAVICHGLPHAEYFIYNDDLEYTARILRRGTGYWVPASLTIHATGFPRMPHEAGGERFFYDVRNRIFVLRGDSWSRAEKGLLLHQVLANVRTYLRANHFRVPAVRTVLRALLDGFTSPAPHV